MTQERGTKYGVVHLRPQADPQATLASFLNASDIADADSLISLGAVYVNDARATSSDLRINGTDYVRVHTTPRRHDRPTDLKNRIIETTSNFYIVDKPAGIPVHSQVDNSQENLISFLEQELNEKLFITHRLDLETSGCILVARTIEAQRTINQLFRDRLVKKNYVAQVECEVEPGHYIHFMQPSFNSPKTVSTDEQEGWVRCELIVISCTPLGDSAGVYEVEIELLTGRPQQIRAQLAYLGAPITGDHKYGSTVKSLEPNSIGLRCSALGFDRALL